MTHHTQGHNQDATPLSDDVYNVIAALHEKSMALAAYEEYLEDAEDEQSRDHWERMIEIDQECVQMCESELRRLIGKNQPQGMR